MSPSTEWREQIDADEDQRFGGYAERIAAMQKQKSAKYGNGRAFHRKQVLGLGARLEVLGDLPAHARQGLFAEARTYDARIRLSNGSVDVMRDRRPDIRGFGLRVLGVDGAGALGGTTKAQDFVLINREVFGFSKPDEFVELVTALVDGPLTLVRQIVRRYGFFGGLARLREISRGMARPFSGFATESFFSAAPMANGPYAVRVRLRPAGDSDGGGDERLGRRHARASVARADSLRPAAAVLRRREDDADRGRRRRSGPKRARRT